MSDSSADTLRTSYEAMPYAGDSHPQTHPDRLATVATLFGMTPASIERCRVLELGCAAGANLIPMAANLPGSQFVGVDFSNRQIQDGLQLVQRFGLNNIELRQADIRQIDDTWGRFDYIIAHGVYSWVPADVQDYLFTICSRNLAPNGVAFVSYNTYPGWHMLRMLRDMMRYHADKYQDPTQRTHHARALLYFLAQATPRPDHPYTRVLQHAVKSLNPYADSYIFHEYLEAINEPIYFHQFLEFARAKKLQYIAEADVVTMGSSDFAPDVNQVLTQLSADWFERQQFLDFVLGRQFRESLLCHADVTLDDGDRPQRIPQFHIASATRSNSPNADVLSTADETFPGPRVGSLTTSYPIVKAALRHLADAWPATVPFDELEAAAHHRIYPHGGDPVQRNLDRDLLATTLLRGYLQIDLFELHIKPLPLVSTVSERPMAMPFARMQASQVPRVTNQRHEPLNLTELERYVLWKLDGESDHAALLRTLDEPAGQAVIARSTATGDNSEKLANCLGRLAKAGLLVR